MANIRKTSVEEERDKKRYNRAKLAHRLEQEAYYRDFGVNDRDEELDTSDYDEWMSLCNEMDKVFA